MIAVHSLARVIGVAPACDALRLPRSTWYRRRKPKAPAAPRTPSPRALTQPERQQILDQVHSERFLDVAIPEIHATLLDEGTWLGSARTMYRVVDEAQEVRERRSLARHPAYPKPSLVATRPNQVWSWDITKLKGPVAYTYFHLYVILDIFSRYVVGWLLALTETAQLAKDLIEQTCDRQGVHRDQLVIHSDRGASMTSKPVAQLLAELGITRSLSRPHVSNDNAYSESQFKTLKYHPTFPRRFGSLQDGLAFCRQFFDWHNLEHRHSGIAWLTPADVHSGRAADVLAARQETLWAAYRAHPERFPHGRPVVPQLPTEVWINPPELDSTRQDAPGPTIVTSPGPQDLPISPPGQVGGVTPGRLWVPDSLARSNPLLTGNQEPSTAH